jgi:hypothetical protein
MIQKVSTGALGSVQYVPFRAFFAQEAPTGAIRGPERLHISRGIRNSRSRYE